MQRSFHSLLAFADVCDSRVRRALTRGLFAALVATVASTAAAAPVRTPHVEAELVAERTAIVPGEPLTVALRLAMERGWHTYWQNAGDSGLPTTITWKLPAGITAGPIQWATPQALPVGPLLNYGYEGEVLLLTDLAVARELAADTNGTLAARVDWLVCKETCIPEGVDLTLTLPVAGARGSGPSSVRADVDPRWGKPIADARDALPRPLANWNVVANGRGPQVEIALTPIAGTAAVAGDDLRDIRFFPFKEGQIEASGAQTLRRDAEGSGWKLNILVASQRVGDFTRVAGVLAAGATAINERANKGSLGGARAVVIDTPLIGAVEAGAAAAPVTETLMPLAGPGSGQTRPPLGAGLGLGAPAPAPSALSLGVALAFAFAGGLLLNLMPCVFPVLSLKVLGFAVQGGGPAAMRKHGIAFAGGVIVSFWVLAALLVQLRSAGQQLGWGFQLQSPAVIVALAVLFFALALNLSGLFEIRSLLPSPLAGWNAKNPYVNDVLSGVLAVVVASPCSAPFMGAALGYALLGNASSTWIVFTALGLGMAAPYVLLAFFPSWRTKLPKAGAWMVRLKQLLAFPLYATVIWLAWVLGAQLNNDAVARLAITLLLLALGLWSWQSLRAVSSRGSRGGWFATSIASIAAAIVVVWPIVANSADTVPGVGSVRAKADSGPWDVYAPERVAQLVDAGRPVFVDFTAAWCVTCQINKGLVLNTDPVQQAFARGNVALVRADWTRRDATIGAALAALGRDGVPVYVLYRPGKEPLLLPEVLRQQDILDAVAPLAAG